MSCLLPPLQLLKKTHKQKHLAQGKGVSAEREEAQFITQEMGFCPLTNSNTLRRNSFLSIPCPVVQPLLHWDRGATAVSRMGALMLGPGAAAILAPKMVSGRAKGSLGRWWLFKLTGAAVLLGFWHTLDGGSEDIF